MGNCAHSAAAARPMRLPSGAAGVGLRADQCYEAVVVILASGAALEVRSHARDRRVGVSSAELELDVVVEVLEAPRRSALGPAAPALARAGRWWA
jgi:hypothetical protein